MDGRRMSVKMFSVFFSYSCANTEFMAFPNA